MKPLWLCRFDTNCSGRPGLDVVIHLTTAPNDIGMMRESMHKHGVPMTCRYQQSYQRLFVHDPLNCGAYQSRYFQRSTLQRRRTRDNLTVPENSI